MRQRERAYFWPRARIGLLGRLSKWFSGYGLHKCVCEYALTRSSSSPSSWQWQLPSHGHCVVFICVDVVFTPTIQVCFSHEGIRVQIFVLLLFFKFVFPASTTIGLHYIGLRHKMKPYMIVQPNYGPCMTRRSKKKSTTKLEASSYQTFCSRDCKKSNERCLTLAQWPTILSRENQKIRECKIFQTAPFYNYDKLISPIQYLSLYCKSAAFERHFSTNRYMERPSLTR